MHDLEIEFIGLHYRAGEKLTEDFDPELAKFQIHYLYKNGKWLTDDQARKKNMLNERMLK